MGTPGVVGAPRRRLLTVQNLDIARVLSELADLLEIQEANPFRVRAYRNAVRTVDSLTRSLETMVREGEDLTQLPGIGADISSHITELVETGRLRRFEEVAAEVPPELVTLMKLDGVGSTKARKLWEELGVTGLDELEAAVEDGKVEALAGFGKKSAEKILRSIADHRKRQGRFLLSEADELVRPLLDHLEEARGVKRLDVAGSYRRRRETVGDLDILVLCDDEPGAVMEHFLGFPAIERVEMSGDTRGSVALRSGLEVDVRILPRRSYGAALHYFTGSKEHNVAIRKRGVKRGLRISEWGVFRVPGGADLEETGKEEGERVGGERERDVFEAVGLPWIPPALREDRGEVEAAEADALPELMTLDDIRGDLHMHSTWSDGKYSVQAMAEACVEHRYEYMAVTDHTQALAMVRGLTPKRAREQWKELDALRDRMGDEITLFRGAEVDIHRDGSLDLPDEILAELDLVVISVHSLMDLDRATQTARVVTAMEHPASDILAHPTGRILGKRGPFALDVEAVLQAAADLDVAVELNAHPNRLDLNDVHVRRAKELGVRVVISTDAHSIRHLDHMRYGVDQARRGWLEKADVLNAMSLEEITAWLDRDRG